MTDNVSARDRRIADSVLDPVKFAKLYFNIDLWAKQREILNSIAVNQRTAVKSCHSSGKTFTSALATLWFLASHPREAIVITTAPTYNQVQKQLWGEIKSLLIKSKLKWPDPSLTELKLGPKRYVTGLTTSVTKGDEGVKFQGFHADDILVILDEAPGVDPKIWEAIEGARAGGNVKILAIGNPTIASGPFHDAFINNRSGWHCISISAFDTPNLEGITLEQLIDNKHPQYLSDEELKRNQQGFLTTRSWVKEKYFEWGPTHPAWETRVLGCFPSQSDDALFGLMYLEKAKNSDVEPRFEDKITAGLDVAGPGEDETALTVRKGPKIIYCNAWADADPRGKVVAALIDIRREFGPISAVNVDKLGIGWGMFTHLKELGFPVVPINVTETSHDSEQFFNSRAEFCWGFRLRLQKGDVSGLLDDKTIGQLAGMRFKQNARGQIEIESKDSAWTRRGVKSPDRAESVLLAFAERSRSYSALDYYKGMMGDMDKTQVLMKPSMPDKPKECPSCAAVCVVQLASGFRCNQCGTQFGGRAHTIGDSNQRTDYLAKLERDRKRLWK